MNDTIKLRNYGVKSFCDFPSPDSVREVLEDGEIAVVRDLATMYDYILTKQLCCWTNIGSFKFPEPVTNKRHMEKVYEVEFMEYTNCMRDTVSNQAKEIGDMKYINVGKEPFLVRESELDKYMAWGKGFRVIKFVDNIGD